MIAQQFPTSSPPPTPLSERELDELVAAFDQRRLPKTAWTHTAHLRVGCCYILAFGETAAVDRLRRGIRLLNGSHGLANSESSGYHETLTRFWVTLLACTLQEYKVLRPNCSRANAVHACAALYFNRSRIVDDYWTFDVVRSTACRSEWRSPDAAPLDVVVFPCNAKPLALDIGEWRKVLASEQLVVAQAMAAFDERAAVISRR